MAGNLRTTLRRSRAAAPSMQHYDSLPPDLRRWLAQAALPWSPRSLRKLWSRFSVECAGDIRAIYRRLDQAEARALARDACGLPGGASVGKL